MVEAVDVAGAVPVAAGEHDRVEAARVERVVAEDQRVGPLPGDLAANMGPEAEPGGNRGPFDGAIEVDPDRSVGGNLADAAPRRDVEDLRWARAADLQ